MTFKVPEVFEGADGWQTYLEAPTWDISGVAELTPGTGSPEAAVVHFYASRMRGDTRFEEVLQRSDIVARKLEKSENWKFHSLRLVSRKQRSRDRYYVKVAMDVEREGEIKPYRDDVTVENIEGAWKVTRPPS